VTDEQKAELRRLEKMATSGPWRHVKDSFDLPEHFIVVADPCAEPPTICGPDGPDEGMNENYDFIVAMRNALPALLDENELLGTEVQRQAKVIGQMIDVDKQRETHAIDKLFLELSQFSRAKTKRELALEEKLARAEAALRDAWASSNYPDSVWRIIDSYFAGEKKGERCD